MGDVIKMGYSLTSKQQEAILLFAEGYSRCEVSERLKVAPKTVSNWKCDPKFRAELESIRSQIFSDGVKQLQSLVGLAGMTLRQVMSKGSRDADRVAAARAVYQFTDLRAELLAPANEQHEDHEVQQAAADILELIRQHAG
jgi:hypothetical protein